jgi:hypothetical protein
VTPRAFSSLLLAFVAPISLQAQTPSERVWEVNGVRLEAGQVERLATDIARQTVAAVERQPGIGLRPDQESALGRIYHTVALDTYDRVVAVVNRSELDDAAKEVEVKRLVIAGQEQSSARVAEVLDAVQYRTYRAWEEKQVRAFRERGLWSGARRTRRSRP